MGDFQPIYTASHALVVGINSYNDPRFVPLGKAEDDANAFGLFLRTAVYNFNVMQLTGAEATRKAILEGLFRLRSTKPDDRVLVYFAGHGYTLSDRLKNETGYLAAADTVPEQDFTALALDEVTELIRYAPAKHIAFIFDACFSGQALGLTRAPAVASDKFMTRRAYQVISAGAGDQTVSDFQSMTSLMLNALRGGVANQDGMVTFGEMGLYLQQTMSADSNSTQIPQFGHLRGSQGGDFVFSQLVGPQLPFALEETLSSGPSNSRLGAVVDLIEMARSESTDLANLAKLRLADVASHDSDERVRNAAQSFFDENKPREGENTAARLQRVERAREITPREGFIRTPTKQGTGTETFKWTLPAIWNRYRFAILAVGGGAGLALLLWLVVLAGSWIRGHRTSVVTLTPTQPPAVDVGQNPITQDSPVQKGAPEATEDPTRIAELHMTATAEEENTRIKHVQDAVRAFDREMRRALETGDITGLSSVARGSALQGRLDAVDILKKSGNCHWVYDQRGIDVMQPTFPTEIHAQVRALVDRDGRVFCDQGEEKRFAFTGPYFADYVLQIFDGEWLVTVYTNVTDE